MKKTTFNDNGVFIPPFKGLKSKFWHLATSYKNTEFIIENQLNLCRSMFHNRGQNLENLDYDKNSLMKFKNKYNMVNGYFPEVNLSLAFYMSKSLNESEKYIHKLNKEHTGSNKPYVVIPTCPNHFYDLIHEYQENFNIDEFILYDLGKDNAEKIQNVQIISELFHLKKTVA
ncbi:MAG: hypothetical protein WBA61_02735 [Aequorivita sp.]